MIQGLFAVVVIAAVPMGLARLRLADPVVDRFVAALSVAGLPASVALAVGVRVGPGFVAGALTVPWLVLGVVLALAAAAALARGPRRLRPTRRLAVAIAFGFLAFGAANATSYALGFRPLGFSPTIVLLTAVHFHAAGFVLMTAGILACDRRPTRATALGVGLVAAGSIVTAAGFAGVPVAATVGAMAVATGGLLVGWATVRVGPQLEPAGSRALATVAGGALFVSMPLAFAWVIGGAIGLPTLGLDVMVRTHGAINAIGVSVPAMAAWTLDARTQR